MNINQITDYVNSNEHIGLDRVLKLQLKTDGWLASKIGLSSLGPTGFIFGFFSLLLYFCSLELVSKLGYCDTQMLLRFFLRILRIRFFRRLMTKEDE